MSLARYVYVVTVILIQCLSTPGHAHAAEPLNEAALAQELDGLFDSAPAAKRTTLALKVVDLETGEVLYDRGGDKLLTPASNLKIYTAAAALDLLGPDYRWKTEIITSGEIEDGVCNEMLYLRGGGDPMFNTEQFESMVDQLKEDHALEKISGGVAVIHSPRWRNVPIKGPGWMWDDDPDYYNMSIRSLMLNFNTIKYTVPSGEADMPFMAEPPSEYPWVSVERQTEDDEPAASIRREPFSNTVKITVPANVDANPVSDTITMHDPSPWIEEVFLRMLRDKGIEIIRYRGRHWELKFVELLESRVLVSHQGKPMREALRHFLKVSENAVGEMVLLKLAETQTKDDVSWPVGAKVITDWLVNTAGLEEGSFRLVDGSGLSRYNLISADSSVRLLAFMKDHEHFEPFFDGLPVYKVDLPKQGKWGGVPYAEFDPERVFAKPGGMSGVSTISGYIKTLDGRWLAFSLLGNGYTGSSKPVRDLRNEVWAELVRYKAIEVGFSDWGHESTVTAKNKVLPSKAITTTFNDVVIYNNHGKGGTYIFVTDENHFEGKATVVTLDRTYPSYADGDKVTLTGMLRYFPKPPPMKVSVQKRDRAEGGYHLFHTTITQ